MQQPMSTKNLPQSKKQGNILLFQPQLSTASEHKMLKEQASQQVLNQAGFPVNRQNSVANVSAYNNSTFHS